MARAAKAQGNVNETTEASGPAKQRGGGRPRRGESAAGRATSKAKRVTDGDGAFQLSVDRGIATLRFDLPGQRVNLLTVDVMRDLDQMIAKLAEAKNIRCLLITSGKSGNFIAGADIKQFVAITNSADSVAMSGSGQEVMNRIEDLPLFHRACTQVPPR